MPEKMFLNNLFILLMRISLRTFLTSDCEKVESLYAQFSSKTKPLKKKKNSATLNKNKQIFCEDTVTLSI